MLVGVLLTCAAHLPTGVLAGMACCLHGHVTKALLAQLATTDVHSHVHTLAAVNGFVWLIDAHMEGGQLLHPYVWSLGAFWPGLQVLAGQVEEGRALHANWTSAWRKFGWLPEMFDIQVRGGPA